MARDKIHPKISSFPQNQQFPILNMMKKIPFKIAKPQILEVFLQEMESGKNCK